jgi:PAS domain S-box-containing protein
MEADGGVRVAEEEEKSESADRKETTEKLIKAILDTIPISVYCKDKDARFVYVSKGFYTEYGESYRKKFGVKLPEDVIGKTDLDLFLEEHAKKMFEEDKRIMETGKPIVDNLEFITAPDGSRLYTVTTKVPLYDEKGNIIGLVGATRDVTEQMRLEEELIRERDLFKIILDTLPIAVYYKDKDGRLIHVGKGYYTQYEKYAKKFGFRTLEDVTGKTDFDLFPKEHAEKMFEDDRRVMEKGESIIDKVEYFTAPDGTEHYILTTKIPRFDEKGNIMGLVGVSRDLTERMELEKELARQRDLLETILDTIPIHVYCKDREGRLLYVSKGFYKQYEENYGKRFGLKLPKDVIGKTDFDLFLKEHAEKMFEDDRRVMEKGESIIDKLEYFSTPDGTEQYAITTKVPWYDEKGDIVGLVGATRDVTEQKKLEKELTYERDLFKNLMENLPLSVFFKDTQGRLLRVSDSFVKLVPGTPPLAESVGEVIGKTDFDLFPEELAKAFAEDDKRIIETKQPIIGKEERSIGTNGREIYLLTTKAPLLDAEGNVMGIVGITRDITERKLAEKKLQESEKRYRELVENSPVGIIATDENGVIVYENPAMRRILGVPEGEISRAIGMKLHEMPNVIAAGGADRIREMLRGNPMAETIFPFTSIYGKQLFLSVSGLPLKDSEGRITGSLLLVQDITDRKRAEEAILFERNLLRSLLDHTPDLIWFMDKDVRYIATSKSHADYLGVSSEDMIGKTDLEFYPKEIAEKWIEHEKHIMETGESMIGKVEKIRSPTTGKELWVSTTKMPLYDEKGNVMGTFGISRDIFELKRMEEALRKSEEKYRSLVESSGDSIYMLSRDLRYLSANKALLLRLGISSEDEIVGRLYSDFHSPAETRELLETIRKVFDTGEVVYQEHVGRVPDTWFLRTLSPYRDSQTGEVVAVTVVSKDITERKRAEEERAKLLAEAAAGRVATEIIDGMIDGVVVTDLKGRIIQTNAASNVIFRTTREESLGKHLTEFISEEEVPLVLDLLSKVIKTGEPVKNVEFAAIRKDGTKFPLLTSGSLLRDEEGRPNRLLIVYRDITKLKQAEEERAAAERARTEETERFAKELQARVEELEKLHRLTVGRELKMMQMEREMEKLKKKLEELKKKPRKQK